MELGNVGQVFKENQYINVVRFHPLEASLFLAGGSKGTIKLWDIRIGSSVCEYSKSLGQVLDVDFSPDGKRFISTSDIAKRNASDKALVVWNFARQIPLSNQVSFCQLYYKVLQYPFLSLWWYRSCRSVKSDMLS